MIKICMCCKHEITGKAIFEFSGYVTDVMDIKSKKVPKKGRPKVFQCVYCGLVQIFDEQEENSTYKDCIGREVISKEKTEYRLKQFEWFIKRNKLTRRNIIEIGAGRGDYMKIMEQVCHSVYGIEHNNKTVKRANDHGLNMIEGFIDTEDYYISGSPYSSFYMINYLNRVPEPDKLLHGIHNNIVKSAPGFIEVPNIDYIIKNKLSEEFNMVNYSYYNKSTLYNMLSCNGFEVLEISEDDKGIMLHAEVRRREMYNRTIF